MRRAGGTLESSKEIGYSTPPFRPLLPIPPAADELSGVVLTFPAFAGPLLHGPT